MVLRNDNFEYEILSKYLKISSIGWVLNDVTKPLVENYRAFQHGSAKQHHLSSVKWIKSSRIKAFDKTPDIRILQPEFKLFKRIKLWPFTFLVSLWLRRAITWQWKRSAFAVESTFVQSNIDAASCTNAVLLVH